jgi:hypothetical protein
MFRKRDQQQQLTETTYLLPPKKRERLENTWAHVFREKALPLIKEEPFAGMYDAGNGRPNKPVQVMLGILILKDVFDLTDEEVVEQVEFNVAWQHALRLTPEDAHLCTRTIEEFRAKLAKHKGGQLAFEGVLPGILAVLGTRTERQRLDSTHLLSNVAVLTRLGLFCETLRVALAALRRAHPKLFLRIPVDLRRRYLKDDGTETRYRDAKSEKGQRRVAVCARDIYRVLEICRGKAAAKLEGVRLLQRLFDEQCDIVVEPKEPSASDDDAGAGSVPVAVKDPKSISSASLQTPHDPDVTYSGHKGKGFEAQIAETCHEDNDVEIITHISLTPSCESDDGSTIPVLDDLTRREVQPAELIADTTYGSANNAVEAAKRGTELVSPVGGTAPAGTAPVTPRSPGTPARSSSQEFKEQPLTAADFKVDVRLGAPAVCPAGHESTAQRFVGKREHTVALEFDAATCATCPLASRCPSKAARGADKAVVRINLEQANLEQRRRAADPLGDFDRRYSIRAGIEATNSELKRRHGLGKLRYRRKDRVTLAVFLKALACNLTRMCGALLRRAKIASVACV